MNVTGSVRLMAHNLAFLDILSIEWDTNQSDKQ